jgi:hypothetical protein
MRTLQKEKLLADSVRIADMEWAIGIFLVVMFGLYIWSHASAGRRIGEKLQPFVDELFGVSPSGERESKSNPPAKPKGN